MKIEQLRQMIELSKTPSINQAAANLYMSQPNLSLSIRNLEIELGCPLVKRTNRGIILTSYGQDFVKYSQSIITQFDRLHSIGRSAVDSCLPVLSIANMNYHHVVLLVSEFYNQRKDNPFRIIIHDFDRDGVIDSVCNGETEIGFLNILSCYQRDIFNQLKSKRIHFTHLSSDAPVILVGKHNPLYKYDDFSRIPPELLEAYPLVRYNTMDFYHYWDKARLVGIEKTAGELIVSSRSAMHELIENTDAFAIVSYNEKLYKHFAYYPNTRRLSVDGCTLTHEFGWIMQEDAVPSPLVMEFVDMLTSYLI